MIKSLFHFVYIRVHLLQLMLPEFRFLVKELGSNETMLKQGKFRASLIMQSHIIEKGLSLKNTRIGFGVPKVKKLLSQLTQYYKKYGDVTTVSFCLSIIDAYISFGEDNGGADAEILSMYNDLCSSVIPSEDFLGGVIHINKEASYDSSFNYETFVKSRHSVRCFLGGDMDMTLIEKALDIAKYTPSACNRQPWRNYVFSNKTKIKEILDIQTGARQFKEDVSCLILVTSSPNSFFESEYHQHYVNGGLYAMNLLFALHSLGLGTIPLNVGIPQDRLIQLSRCCGLRSEDVPILLIAVGYLPDEYKVACSSRFDYKNYSVFDPEAID